MRQRPSVRRLAIAAAALCLGAPAAATEDDFNIWLGQFATINATDKLIVRLEAQERFTNDADRLGQLLLRGYVGYRFSPTIHAGGGYAYVRTDPVGPVELNEHRFYQEFNVRLVNRNGLTLDSRTRLEQRLFEERDGTSWRLRNFVQLRVPLNRNNRLVLFTEPFIDLNETSVQRGGLSIWRNFAGVSFPLGPRAELVPGYLNQHVFRDGTDRADHTANLNLFMTF
jgi:hypothetical protein